jgi:hypothetical protein
LFINKLCEIIARTDPRTRSIRLRGAKEAGMLSES